MQGNMLEKQLRSLGRYIGGIFKDPGKKEANEGNLKSHQINGRKTSRECY